MWTCEKCGCQGIAGDLARCPGCGEDRVQPVSAPAEVDQDVHEATELVTGAFVAGGAPVIGEQGPEPWDTGKSVAQNLAADPVLKGEHGPELADLPEPSVVTLPADEADSDG